MADLCGGGGELRITLDIKRAATGETERVELVGSTNPDQLRRLGLGHLVNEQKEHTDDGDAQHGGA